MKFKVGDEVVCISAERQLVLYKEYTIKYIIDDEYGHYYIRFDDNYNGYNDYIPERFIKKEEFIQLIRANKIKKIKDKIENKGVRNKLKNFFKDLLK